MIEEIELKETFQEDILHEESSRWGLRNESFLPK